MAWLGIDLGTSNSVAALLIEGDVRIVSPPEGVPYGTAGIFPSYVAFDREGNLSAVGLDAMRMYHNQEELVVRHFKRLIGKPYDYVEHEISKGTRFFDEFKNRIERGADGKILIKVGGKRYSVIEITSFLLKKMWEDAQYEAQKFGESISGVTITLPAAFDDLQREDTLAAAESAGLSNIKIIEEPTAAAIAQGVRGKEGIVMVVDVGAGTTDIVVGHISETKSFVISTRKCDDELGGIDMDNLILEWLLEEDTIEPRLKEIYPLIEADPVEKKRLMTLIEMAKINCVNDGRSFISANLRVNNKIKRISLPLDEETLGEIVAPIVYGFERDGHTRGIKPLIEDALLKLAENDVKKKKRIIQEIEHLILIGGPCKMKAIHKMLAEVFRDNKAICEKLQDINFQDDSFMEDVAKGAALSSEADISITHPVPYNLSIFMPDKGRTLVIPKDTPYSRQDGVTKSVFLEVQAGPTIINIVSEKEVGLKYNWPIKEHLIAVPQEGQIEFTLHWTEAGTEKNKAKIQGAGLPVSIELPPVRDITTIGKRLQDNSKVFFNAIRNIREYLKTARELFIKVIKQEYPEVPQYLIEQKIDDVFYIPEKDLLQCEKIDPEKASEVSESDVEVALQQGFIEMCNRKLTNFGISKRVKEVFALIGLFIFHFGKLPSTEDLISFSEYLISVADSYSSCLGYKDQLKSLLSRLKYSHHNNAIIAAVVTSLSALANCLHDAGIIDEDIFRLANTFAVSFGMRLGSKDKVE